LVSGEEIIVGLRECSLYIYRKYDGEEMFSYQFKGSNGHALTCTSDNNLIVFAIDSEIRIYNRKLKSEYVFHNEGNINSSGRNFYNEISQDNKILYRFASRTKSILSYNLETRQQISQQIFKGKSGNLEPNYSVFLQNEKFIAFWDRSKGEVYDCSTGNCLLELNGGEHSNLRVY